MILVTGATGAQGGATLRALLKKGIEVRALVRNPHSKEAIVLSELGAELIVGDLNNEESLVKATSGVHGVFSIQQPDQDGSDSERRQGFALISAARQSGVSHFVHTSVCEAGKHESFPFWDEGYWSKKYWTDKWDIEEKVRASDFATWTILKPAFMMDNFIKPKSRYMFPQLKNGVLATAFEADAKLQLISANNIGLFAQAAFTTPEDFNGLSIDLAVEALTMTEVANHINAALGTTVETKFLTYDDAMASGLAPGWVQSQKWVNVTGGYKADIARVESFGLDTVKFSQWISLHASTFAIAT